MRFPSGRCFFQYCNAKSQRLEWPLRQTSRVAEEAAEARRPPNPSMCSLQPTRCGVSGQQFGATRTVLQVCGPCRHLKRNQLKYSQTERTPLKDGKAHRHLNKIDSAFFRGSSTLAKRVSGLRGRRIVSLHMPQESLSRKPWCHGVIVSHLLPPAAG